MKTNKRYGDVCETAEEVINAIKEGAADGVGFSFEAEGIDSNALADLIKAELPDWMYSIKRGKSGPDVLWAEVEP